MVPIRIPVRIVRPVITGDPSLALGMTVFFGDMKEEAAIRPEIV